MLVNQPGRAVRALTQIKLESYHRGLLQFLSGFLLAVILCSLSRVLTALKHNDEDTQL